MPNPELPSERKFGFIFAALFALLAIYGAAEHWNWGAISSLAVIGCIFALFAHFRPMALRPLNKVWFQFGLLLGRVVSPVVTGLIFFILITPVALVTRAFGRDALQLRKGTRDTFWNRREPPGPNPASFKNQF